MADNEVVVGIDLGTTNSEVAAWVGEGPKVLGPEGGSMLPSCVGLSPDGELLVGCSARNQSLVYPERTVSSIKRKMGSDEAIVLGEKSFTPAEVSALILRELAEWAAHALGTTIRKAVITVPAYFSDAQRQATREAGALAGLEVLRILNEPTAASLAYGLGCDEGKNVLVYDLGGGTFDVSLVRTEADVTEVLASHGNNHLGGDDFDQLLLDRLLELFQDHHGIDLRDQHPASYSRLRWAAEEAKRKLSFEPYATVREEALATVDGRPLHLETTLTGDDFEEMIRPLVESTLASVSRAINDAGLTAGEIDEVVLVGGSTRIPLVQQTLAQRVGLTPRQDIHPDLCVVLGAGLLASRLAGHDIQRVLVDVSPYSFGPSHLGERDGRPYPHCYRPIIKRNTPLPVTRTESYYTVQPYQPAVDIEIYQGEDPDAAKNLLVGSFSVEDLTPVPEMNEVLCRMSLDLDGILRVSAIEKRTGKAGHITISNALQPKSEEELAMARDRLAGLYQARAADLDEALGQLAPASVAAPETIDVEPVESSSRPPASEDETSPQDETSPAPDSPLAAAADEARGLVSRSRKLLPDVHDEDKEELIDLHEQIEEAIAQDDADALSKAVAELRELLFFIEGR